MGGQALQSPEALLGAYCGINTDMWTLGCVVRSFGIFFTLIWKNHFPPQTDSIDFFFFFIYIQLFELLTGDALFDPPFQTLELDITKEESHLIQMIELFGEIPHDLIHAGKYSHRWFTPEGKQYSFFSFLPSFRLILTCYLGNLRLNTTYYPISLRSVLERHIEKSDVVGTTAFLNTLLILRPDDRARPQDIIDHQWFSEWTTLLHTRYARPSFFIFHFLPFDSWFHLF